jgi:hypothetical protein
MREIDRPWENYWERLVLLVLSATKAALDFFLKIIDNECCFIIAKRTNPAGDFNRYRFFGVRLKHLNNALIQRGYNGYVIRKEAHLAVYRRQDGLRYFPVEEFFVEF